MNPWSSKVTRTLSLRSCESALSLIEMHWALTVFPLPKLLRASSFVKLFDPALASPFLNKMWSLPSPSSLAFNSWFRKHKVKVFVWGSSKTLITFPFSRKLSFSKRSQRAAIKHLKNGGSHSGSRNYACESCRKSLKHTDHLKCHKITNHTSEKPLSCTQCGKYIFTE